MDTVNKSIVSKVISLVYEVLIVFMMAMAAIFLYATYTPMGLFGIIASITSICIGSILLLILLSLYKTQYILTNNELVIRTTRLIGGGKRIPLKIIESVKQTVIPFGIRLFGASFHGGHYHIPGLGRAFMCITNFSDGLLIRTAFGDYVITPRNPANFKKLLQDSMNRSKSS